MDEAIEEACDHLEAEAWQRAVEGVDRPVYHRSQVVGHIREYSDRLLMELLKAHKPEKYRERVETRNINNAEIRVAGIPREEAVREVMNHIRKIIDAQDN